MIKKLFVILLILLIASTAQAARLKLPAEETYFYWINYTDADGQDQIISPTKVEGPKAKIDYTVLGVGPKNVALSVLETETGNVAIQQLKPEDGELPTAITLKEADFDRVRNVSINVTAKNGKPVESALVTLTDAANKTYSQLIEPTSRGIADFHDVAGGVVTVKVVCAGRKSVNDVDIPLEREKAAFSTDIPIPGDVPVLKPETTNPKDGSAPAQKDKAAKSHRPSTTMLLQTGVGLLLLALIAYIGFTIARAKGITFGETLRKAGVQLPGETGQAESTPAAAPEPQIDPNICPFCGQRKDQTSGACGCTVSSAPAATLSSGPRLIGIAGPYLGKIFELNADAIIVGREASNPVALTEDSTTSRRHALILRQSGQFTIQDEGSSNGTLVNGVKIMEPKAISAGDEIQIGSTRFRFEQ